MRNIGLIGPWIFLPCREPEPDTCRLQSAGNDEDRVVEAMAWLPDWPLAAKPAAAAATWLARRRKPAGDRINPHPHEREYNKTLRSREHRGSSTHGAADAS